MAETLTTILDRIRENVIDLPSATEGRLEGWVQEAQRKAEGGFQWIQGRTELEIDTTAGANLLQDLPADFLWPIGNPFFLTGDLGRAVMMEWLPTLEDRSKDYIESTDSGHRGSPKSLMIVNTATADLAGRIEVFPKPGLLNTIGTFSTLGEYEIHIPYHARGVLLSDGGNATNYITENPDLALYLEEFASGKAMLFNHDYNNATAMLTQARATLQEAKKIEKRRKVPVLNITPRRDVHASRRQQRAN